MLRSIFVIDSRLRESLYQQSRVREMSEYTIQPGGLFIRIHLGRLLDATKNMLEKEVYGPTPTASVSLLSLVRPV